MARRICLTEEAALFWQDPKTRARLGRWFERTPRDLPIVIASASPEFELQHAAELLGVQWLIGTRCDPVTGRLLGKNCRGEEKLRRIGEQLGEFEIRAMYTDDARRTARCSRVRRKDTSSQRVCQRPITGKTEEEKHEENGKHGRLFRRRRHAV